MFESIIDDLGFRVRDEIVGICNNCFTNFQLFYYRFQEIQIGMKLDIVSVSGLTSTNPRSLRVLNVSNKDITGIVSISHFLILHNFK